MALEDAKTQVDQAFTRDSLRGLSFENAFGGAASFLRRRYTKVAIRKPAASRRRSNEVYALAQGKLAQMKK